MRHSRLIRKKNAEKKVTEVEKQARPLHCQSVAFHHVHSGSNDKESALEDKQRKIIKRDLVSYNLIYSSLDMWLTTTLVVARAELYTCTHLKGVIN